MADIDKLPSLGQLPTLDPKTIRDAAAEAAVSEVQLGLGNADLRLGEVTSTDQVNGIFTVRLNGDPDPDHLVPNVRPLFSYGPQVGDLTWILKNRSDYIAIGPIGWGAPPSPPRCYAWRSASDTLTDGAWKLVNFDSEVYDEPYNSMHSLISNTSRVIAPEPGNYAVICGISTTHLASTRIDFEVRINAAGSQASGNRIIEHGQNGGGGGLPTSLGRSIDYDFALNDYAELFVRVDTGGNPDATLRGAGLSEHTFLILRKNAPL